MDSIYVKESRGLQFTLNTISKVCRYGLYQTLVKFEFPASGGLPPCVRRRVAAGGRRGALMRSARAKSQKYIFSKLISCSYSLES